MAEMKKPVVKAKSKLTGADITGQKYNTKIKEEAAKIRLKVRMKEKLTPYEKSVLGSDAAIKRMNAKPAAKTTAKPKAPVKKKVQVMPDKISPSKMTPAQKARYLKNPERYDG